MRSNNSMNDKNAELQRQLDENPDNITLAIRLALSYDRNQEFANAIECWERVLAVDPAHPLAWARKSAAHFARFQLNEAQFSAVRALKLSFSREDSGIMARGITALRDQASSIRRRANAMSKRFKRSAVEEASNAAMNAEEAGRLWLKAEKKRLGQSYIAARDIFNSISAALKLPAHPELSDEASDSSRLILTHPEHSLSGELAERLTQNPGCRLALEQLDSTLFIVRGALGETRWETLTESTTQRKLILMVRDRGEVRGQFGNNFKYGYFVGSVRRNRHDDCFVFDRADRKVFTDADLIKISEFLSGILLGWASISIAHRISELFFEGSHDWA